MDTYKHTNNDTKSKRTKHNHATRLHGSTKVYRAWSGMKARCLNPRNLHYQHYGGRGITIHPSWVNDFAQFLRDVGEPPSPQHSLDRYPDNNGNYEPGNVRWATRKEQGNNRRTNVIITHDGESLTLSEWADKLGLPYLLVFTRYREGKRGAKLLEPRKQTPNQLTTFAGITLTLRQWALVSGVKYTCLWERRNTGAPLLKPEELVGIDLEQIRMLQEKT